MKQLKSRNVVFSLILLIVTGQAFASGAKLPVITSDNTTIPTPTDVGQTTTGSIPIETLPSSPGAGVGAGTGAYVDSIKEIVSLSSCIKYSWKNRGRAPAGYIKGVALSYARSLCRLKSQSALSQILSAADSNNDSKDALTHYQTIFSNLSLSNTSSGEESLRALYTLGMGLGMRESSGKYCEGWDRGAGSSRPSSAGEAGAFQSSLDSMSASPELTKLYAEYQAKPERCYLDTFKEGASCSSLSNLGSGAGAIYQAFNKSCPAFATEYAMTMLRIRRAHYGPINRREAEVVPACHQLLKSVQDFVNNDPYACDDLK